MQTLHLPLNLLCFEERSFQMINFVDFLKYSSFKQNVYWDIFVNNERVWNIDSLNDDVWMKSVVLVHITVPEELCTILEIKKEP